MIWLAGFFALIATRNFGLGSAWPALLWSVACLVVGLMALGRMRDPRRRR